MTRPRRRGRRFRVGRGVIALVLGAATTIGVAWGAAFGAAPGARARSSSDVFQLRVGDERYHVQRETLGSWWATRRVWSIWPMAGRYAGLPPFDDPSPEADAVRAGVPWDREHVTERQGWPLRCLSCRVVGRELGGVWESQTLGAITFATKRASAARGTVDVRLAARPIWLGMIGDTIIYAGAWLLLLLGVRWLWGLRRRRRTRRGRCARCGYDLVGDFASGCPECGWGRASEPRAAGRRVPDARPGAAPPPIA